MKMYEEMFARRGIKLGKSELQRVFSIINFGVSSGLGKLLILHHENGSPISGVFILSDGTTDYYQFGASNPEMLKVSGSSYLLLHAIEQAFINGRKYFDMVGMNSPRRGEFKASFNAKVTPYFEIEFSENDEGR
jgi:lipid II:glycine glycyltransferase (peptidoglycan interpeptide bridge formation enzyme)